MNPIEAGKMSPSDEEKPTYGTLLEQMKPYLDSSGENPLLKTENQTECLMNLLKNYEGVGGEYILSLVSRERSSQPPKVEL